MASNKTAPPKKKRGYAPKAIDPEQLKILASIQCTYEEISAVFGLKKRQFIDRINADVELREMIDDGWASGRASIRRQQFKLLSEGNATMGIWLGKQYLGQKDRQEHVGADGGPIQMNVSGTEALTSRIAGLATRLGARSGDSKPE